MQEKLLTPVKSIRKKCLDCSNNQYAEIRECPIKDCALHPYRMGCRPKNIINEYLYQDGTIN